MRWLKKSINCNEFCFIFPSSKQVLTQSLFSREKKSSNYHYSGMDNSQSMSYNAGQAKGQAEVKKDQVVDQASNAMQSAKESCQQAGQQMMDKAHGAADAIKDATGMKK